MSLEKYEIKYGIKDEKIRKLAQIFPESFKDGKINWSSLRESLGSFVEDDEDEKFGLYWPGKQSSKKYALKKSKKTLTPYNTLKKHNFETNNILIEGDNLEVLKILERSYQNKVDLIYIDPPYNTGKDFVYVDNFSESKDEYLQKTNQVDEDGERIVANPKSSGRFHSRWLNMMYSRLYIARNLLAEDGFIFISIDNNEIHHLINICTEIFGEENILSVIANVNNPKGRSDDNFFATSHEYLLAIAKDVNTAEIIGFEPEEKVLKRYNKFDEQGGKYREIDLRKTGNADRRQDREDMFYYFYYNEKTNDLKVKKNSEPIKGYFEIIPLRDDGSDGRWRWGFDTASKNLECLLVRNMPKYNRLGVFEKDFLEGRDPIKPTSSWTFKDVNSERGSERFINLGFEKEVFSNPKPVGTLKRILDLTVGNKENFIVLDFFAGSGSFGDAVLSYNKEHNKKIQYILVQLDQVISPDKKSETYACDWLSQNGLDCNIAEITKERLRRAHADYKLDNTHSFNTFKLVDSDLISQLEKANQIDLIEDSFEVKNVDSMLWDILIMEGYPLHSKIILNSNIKGNNVYEIYSNFVEGKLFICLDEKVESSTVDEMVMDKYDYLICLDTAVSDELKVRLADKGKIKVI